MFISLQNILNSGQLKAGDETEKGLASVVVAAMHHLLLT